METVTDFIFLGFKITVDSYYSHEMKRRLLLGRKAMTNLDSMLKGRDVTLLTKVCLVKAMVFPSSSHVWMWELDHKGSWAPKNWCFWTVVLEETLESPLDCKEISPEYSLEGLMVKFQYFGHLMWRTDSFVKTLMLGKVEGRRRRRQNEMVGWHHWLDGYEFEQAQGGGDGQGTLACCSPWGHRVRHDWVTELTDTFLAFYCFI